MPTSTPRDGSICPKWIENPWANISRFPAAIPSLISDSQTSACFSSGSRTMTTSPLLAASAMDRTSRPSARAFSAELDPSRRPTTTFAPESLRFSAWAWPCDPYPSTATVRPSSFERSASRS
jgi:hypothetical protein